MNNSPLPLSERLNKGASVLGQLWKTPDQRCSAGWSMDSCTCEFPNKFCKARIQWLTLAMEDGRDLEEDPYGLALAMTASEWDATGLQMKIQHPDPAVGLMIVGSSDQCVTGMSYLAKMMDVPEALASTMRVLKTFSKSKVQGVVKSEIAVATATLDSGPELEANPDEAFE